MKKIWSLLSLAIALNSASAFATLQDAKAAFEAGDLQQAEQLFLEQKQDPLAKAYLARIALESDIDDAEAWIEKALAQDDDNAEIHYHRAIVMARQAQNSIFSAMGYAKKSRQSFERAVSLEPDNIEYLDGLFTFHVNAPSIAGGDMEQAKALVEKIAALDKKAGLLAKFEYLVESDQPQAAEQLMTEAQRTYANIPDFFFHAGMYYQREEDYAKAFEALAQSAEKLAESDDSVVAKYAAIYQFGRTAVLSESRLDEGIQFLERYLTEAPVKSELPEKEWAKFRMANLMELRKNKTEAKKVYLSLANVDDKDLRKQVKKKLKRI